MTHSALLGPEDCCTPSGVPERGSCPSPSQRLPLAHTRRYHRWLTAEVLPAASAGQGHRARAQPVPWGGNRESAGGGGQFSAPRLGCWRCTKPEATCDTWGGAQGGGKCWMQEGRGAPHSPHASPVQPRQPTLPGPAALARSFGQSLSTWVTGRVAPGQRLGQGCHVPKAPFVWAFHSRELRFSESPP